jgi:hypothetical protein
MSRPDDPRDGAPAYPVVEVESVELPTVPGLYVQTYHPECPGYGEIRHALSGRRVVYVWSHEAARDALAALAAADWLAPEGTEMPACRASFARALEIDGVTRG